MREFAPIAIVDVELSRPLEEIAPTDSNGRRYGGTRVLVRLHTRPVGAFELEPRDGGLTPSALAAAIWGRLGGSLNEHLSSDGLPEVGGIDAGGLGAVSSPRCLARRETLLREAPHVSVLVVTRDRPDVVGRCLRSLEGLDYPDFGVILVDGSATSETSDLVHAEFPGVHCIRIENGGVCVAKNRGLAAASGEIIAFTDDDAVVDPHWLVEHVAAFDASERVACTTGFALPLELDTPAQLWFEESGAFVEGFKRRVIGLENREPGSLLPYATNRIGAGVSMAWRVSALRELGAFDLALDKSGAEDLALFFDALCGGFEIVYEPAAIVFHQHRRTYEELRGQIYWHAMGLGAYLTRCVLTQPKRLPDFASRIPRGLLYGFSSASPRNRRKSLTFPSELTRAERGGVVRGPYAYLKGVRTARRLRARDAMCG
jgi:glycosyltransferase involved in cell wall biosynthesis